MALSADFLTPQLSLATLYLLNPALVFCSILLKFKDADDPLVSILPSTAKKLVLRCEVKIKGKLSLSEKIPQSSEQPC